MAKKPRSDAKLKHLKQEEQEALWELLTTPQVAVSEEAGSPLRPYTLQELQAEVPLRHGFTVALSTLSEWRAWYGQRLRTQAAMARASQAKLEWLKENPNANPEDLERLGQMVFTSEAVENGDIKAFVALIKANNQKRSLALDERRIKLLEEKAEREEAAQAVTRDEKLTPEEKDARMKEIFGLS
jgi:hypothetical protein